MKITDLVSVGSTIEGDKIWMSLSGFSWHEIKGG